VLYRLKTQSAEVVRILWLSVLGVDASALEEGFGVEEITIRSWISRSGENGRKLHDILMNELELVHVQLDELWGSLKSGGQDMWVWVAIDVTKKLVPVMQIGGRTQEIAYGVIHELKRRLKEACVPVFSTDGLRLYFYALTAHFGTWVKVIGKKAVWEVLSNFVYGQVIKHQKRKRTVEVERRMAWGEEKEYRERTKKAGQSGKINTAFVERVNLTIRQCISKLTRRTWGPAKYASELMEHLEWWRIYYHLARYHESLAIKLGEPIMHKGKQQAQRYRRQTPAMAAGLATKRWTVKELLSYPMP